MASCYPRWVLGFAAEIGELLEERAAALDPPLRLALVRALILMRNKGSLAALELLPTLFRLFRCHDKALKQLLFRHIIAGASPSCSSMTRVRLSGNSWVTAAGALLAALVVVPSAALRLRLSLTLLPPPAAVAASGCRECLGAAWMGSQRQGQQRSGHHRTAAGSVHCQSDGWGMLPADIKSANRKHQDNKLNRGVQTFLYGLLQVEPLPPPRRQPCPDCARPPAYLQLGVRGVLQAAGHLTPRSHGALPAVAAGRRAGDGAAG